MKYLVLLLVLALAWLWWHHKRVERGSQSRSTRGPDQSPQAMVVCPVCQVHLPRSEAFVGRSGAYCSEAHRARHEA